MNPEHRRFVALDTLPPGYELVRRLDLEDFRLLVLLNLAGFALMGVGWGAFALIAPALPAEGANPLSVGNPLALIGAILVGMILMLIVHELLHGLAFLVFGARPRFGFSPHKGVAFAAADHFYLSRAAYLVVALTPLVGFSLLTVIGMGLTSGEMRTVLALTGALNVGGAVGDVWFVRVCLRFSGALLVRDFGEGAELYMPR